jgi:hypothetical protein
MNISDIKHIHIADEEPIKDMTGIKKRPFSKHKNIVPIT